MFWLVNFDAKKFRTFLFFLNKNMNERKLLIDTDTRHTTSSALQHSESFMSLAPFVGTIKIEHFSFLRWLVNFGSHCICNFLYQLYPSVYDSFESIICYFFAFPAPYNYYHKNGRRDEQIELISNVKKEKYNLFIHT